MSSTSSTASTAGLCIPHCRCGKGKQARLRTSWTDDNPGRRFYGCANWKRGGGGCGFFEWYDLPIQGRARSVILSMLHKEPEAELKIRDLETKNKELEQALSKVANVDAAKSDGSCNIM